MAGWDWLTKPQTDYTWSFVFRVVIKMLILFVLFNLIFAVLQPLAFINSLSLYNWLIPGRERLPFGEDDRAYNLSLNSVEGMFASHVIRQSKADDEFRVVLIGDSGMWGILLRPEETLAGQLNEANITLDDGRTVRAYNLGHPIMSLTKDLMLLEEAMQYRPDMIIWLTTLESFPRERQIFAPIVQNNPERVRNLITTYDLDLDVDNPEFVELNFMDQTIVGQRRELADWLRLQLFGFMWAITGIDQYYPDEYDLRTSDFEEDESWQSFGEPSDLTTDDLAFDVIHAGHELVGDVPLILINEPIFISDGENSDLRYNIWYPRWAYDQYRDIYLEEAEANDWVYVDLWDMIASEEFTDSPVHLTPEGSAQLAERVTDIIIEQLTTLRTVAEPPSY